MARSTDGGRTFAPAVVAVPGGRFTATTSNLAGFGTRPALVVQRGAGTGGQDRINGGTGNDSLRGDAGPTPSPVARAGRGGTCAR